MKPEKVQKLLEKLPRLEEELGGSDVFNDQKRYKELTQEHRYLSNLKNAWESYQKASSDIAGNKQLLKEDPDEEFANIVRQDLEALEKTKEELGAKIELLLVPPDPTDHANTILELRAGTGGDEASLFVGDCVRMYKLFADRMGWKYEEMSSTPSEVGGFKEFVMVITGENAYRMLKFEAGTHRVQRVPETETQGRVHTSAITVAVLMEPTEEEDVQVDESDLKIDTYRASGAGGQHVNTTDSAVRITHIPTGVVVCCQDERSQIKNRAKAMRILKAKIAEAERMKKEAEIAKTRQTQVGTGDRSERIRTYNFPQNRLTDHRINLTKYSLKEGVMMGELDEVVQALVAHDYELKHG